MITLPSEDEVSIYESDAGFIVVAHYDHEHGRDVVLTMQKRRAIELANAIKKVVREAE